MEFTKQTPALHRFRYGIHIERFLLIDSRAKCYAKIYQDPVATQTPSLASATQYLLAF